MALPQKVEGGKMADSLEMSSSAEALLALKGRSSARMAGGPSSSKSSTSSNFLPPSTKDHPNRVRKRNRNIYNDNEETSYMPAKSSRRQIPQKNHTKDQSRSSNNSVMNLPPRKSPVPSSASSNAHMLMQPPSAALTRRLLSTPDKRAAQTIGVHLRNLLKLPKAHKWVCYEWFYSNIDEMLFKQENDFIVCLNESFPHLKTTQLRRAEWSQIRRLMGKPRRCSPSFFAEERATLQMKREKIRLLQQRKATDMIPNLKDMPKKIPLQLCIGTKVTARLRYPQDGLFVGQIEAVDTRTHTYRVIFERPGLGVHSVPDVEVRSCGPPETIALSAFTQRVRPRQQVFMPPGSVEICGAAAFSTSPSLLANDPMLPSAPVKTRLLSNVDGGHYGGFPVKFLLLISRLSRMLVMKKEFVEQMKQFNSDAEKQISLYDGVSADFKTKFAKTVMQLERLNRDLTKYMDSAQRYAEEIAPDVGLEQSDAAPCRQVRATCEEDARGMIRQLNSQKSHRLKNPETITLCTKLTALCLQLKSYATAETPFDWKALNDSVSDIKAKLTSPNNLSAFQDNVELNVNHIQGGLTQLGNLQAFAAANLDGFFKNKKV